MVLLSSCNEKYTAEQTTLTLTADKTEVQVGESVTFTFAHNAQNLTIFTGDAGHDYQNSTEVRTAEYTQEELLTNVVRDPDPDVVQYYQNFADFSSYSDLSGVFDIMNAANTTGSSVWDTNGCDIVYDSELGQNVIEINAINPNLWAEYLRFYPGGDDGLKIADNKRFTIRMKFASTQLTNTSTGEAADSDEGVQAHIRLIGHCNGGTATFNGTTDASLRIVPSTEYTDYEFNLATIMGYWESAIGVSMDYIDNISIMLRIVSNVGYVGKYYIESATFGENGYLPFDSGQAVPVVDNSGVTEFEYTYSEAGTYNVVGFATNTSYKDYDYDGYDISRAMQEIQIKVVE